MLWILIRIIFYLENLLLFGLEHKKEKDSDFNHKIYFCLNFTKTPLILCRT